MIRVLVVEDSPTVRQLLVAMLESDPEIRVVGQATDGRDGVRQARQLEPDLITMDVHMPELDGLAATKEIMTLTPTPIIIVSSAANDSAVALSLDATQAGALMVLPKPESPLDAGFEEQRAQLTAMTKAMAQVKLVRRWAPRRRTFDLPLGPRRLRDGDGDRIRIVAIGCSTGGPAALRTLLSGFPSDFPLPIVVVQHMARGFVSGLATWLDGGSPLRVKVAEHREQLQGGLVYLAPDDYHLGVGSDGRAIFSEGPAIGGFRPSVTQLFSSVADSFGAGSLAVIMTGMGNDGVAGLALIKAADGQVLAQDEASSVVYGMAQEAVRSGLTDLVLPLEAIAPRILEVVR